jgi:uncharacterized membrane protein YdfJ with MMPL/SSD domain
MRDFMKKIFISKQEAIGVVEIILILVILIGLIIIFRNQITDLLETILETITGGANDIATLPSGTP